MGDASMIHTVAISGFRSLRDVVVPLGQVTVITGANGTGKSSVYRALRLLADITDDRIIASIAHQGGFRRLLWAGPESVSKGMRDGSLPIQGTVRKGPIALKLGIGFDALAYAIELGLPIPDGRSLFGGDPEIKREVLWQGTKPTPSRLIADRHGPSIRYKTDESGTALFDRTLDSYTSMLRELVGETVPSVVASLRRQLAGWRFYDHIRTDDAAPARQPQIGTRSVLLAPDGANLAAAVQTIYEIGDGEALNAAIAHAFDGATLVVEATEGGLFQLSMRQRGMLRALSIAELSDGTLRFILLAVAILSPRPSPLFVLNEPEASLHSSVIPALAGLIRHASDDGQIIVVSHNQTLVSSLLGADTELVELHKDTGETFATHSGNPSWTWPKR